MYARCGVFAKAREVLDGLPVRDVVAWSALIAGYAQGECGHEALECFEHMQLEGLSPDAVTFICILKACASLRALDKGKNVHVDIVGHGLLASNAAVGNTLVDMYAKCRELVEAKVVLDLLPIRDLVAWNTIIAAHGQEEHAEEALNCFEQMQYEGLSPDSVTFICILKACGNIGALEKGEDIHCQIVRCGLVKENVALNNALVDMYAKCGELMKAKKVVEGMPARDVVTWSTLITRFAQGENPEEALNCLEHMQSEGFSPNIVTSVCILKACGTVGDVEKGEKIHAGIVKQRWLDEDFVLGSALVGMYAKCGALEKAREALYALPVRYVTAWNALITGYMQEKRYEEALQCFEQMQCQAVMPDVVTFTCVIKACGIIKALDEGENIHLKIANQGLLSENVVLGIVLVDMYAKCDLLEIAREVLEGLPIRDVITWNALIAGYLQSDCKEVMYCLEQMQLEGLCPDTVTFICGLKACGNLGMVYMGQSLHSGIGSLGLLTIDIELANALVDMYARLGVLMKAKSVLEELPVRDVISWSAFIAGAVQEEHEYEALNCFGQMQLEGVLPNVVTLMCICKACGNMGELERGEDIHAEVFRQGLLEENSLLVAALVDMYVNCGAFLKAKEMLLGLPVRNSIAWNMLVVGYAQGGHDDEVLACFEEMQRNGLPPDVTGFIYILKACGSFGAINIGQVIHAQIIKHGLLENAVLGGALVDMYAKCGTLFKAKEVIEGLSVRNVVAWNALLTGYVKQEYGKEALNCLFQMQLEGLIPDDVTFLSVLNACNHSGLLDEGHKNFTGMSTAHGITPRLEHFTCMVNLYGNAGFLDRAVSFMNKMPSSDHFPAWIVLLNACKKWGNVKLGRWAFKHMALLDINTSTVHAYMDNVHTCIQIDKEASNFFTINLRKRPF